MNKLIYFRSNRYAYIYYTTIDIFMGINPPCKKCLIQNMCMRFLYNNCGSVFEYLELEFKRCDNLIDFMLYNKDFDILEKGKIKWKKIVQ